MLLEFLGAAHEVTGSCHFLQCQDKRILVDCGRTVHTSRCLKQSGETVRLGEPDYRR